MDKQIIIGAAETSPDALDLGRHQEVAVLLSTSIASFHILLCRLE